MVRVLLRHRSGRSERRGLGARSSRARQSTCGRECRDDPGGARVTSQATNGSVLASGWILVSPHRGGKGLPRNEVANLGLRPSREGITSSGPAETPRRGVARPFSVSVQTHPVRTREPPRNGSAPGRNPFPAIRLPSLPSQARATSMTVDSVTPAAFTPPAPPSRSFVGSTTPDEPRSCARLPRLQRKRSTPSRSAARKRALTESAPPWCRSRKARPTVPCRDSVG